MAVIFGSARIDERGKLSGGAVGDQKQTTIDDYKGEVSMQTGYVHSKGWVILRPTTHVLANALAQAMKNACNNKHLGYDQSNRLGVIKYGINTVVDTECDCSSLVRACCNYAGVPVGNFTTANAVTMLIATKKFTKVEFTSLSLVQTGDILVTKTKGHIVICVSGIARGSQSKPICALPTIKNGTTGTQAKYLQQDLNEVANAGLTVDGSFGSKSVAALKKWQSAAGLTADGSYGPKSYEVMLKLLS